MLTGEYIQARRSLLEEVAVWVELDKDRGKVRYTFPLRDAGPYTVPPGRSFIKVCTLEYAVTDR
jgi:hypothetical protein